jgi:chromate transporter
MPMREVFGTFLRLGLTSFGGPLAHIAYFRHELVERRRWLSEEAFAHVTAFCSVLPGPTSSQVGMIAGLMRAGPGGAFAAWLGFTLPSALLMTLAATALDALETSAHAPLQVALAGFLAGLTAAAAGIIGQAVINMARAQCPDTPTRLIAAGALIVALITASALNVQWLPIVLGAGAGLLFLRARPLPDAVALPIALSRRVSIGCGIAFVAIALAALLLTNAPPAVTLLATIVRAGSFVFGGGHVVLPLLQSVVGNNLISARDFYAGYGAVQAMPGPVFTFATFLGTANHSPLHGALGAIVATLCIFLPSFLLIFALLPVWNVLRQSPATSSALRGANAAVVGLLGALLCSPILVSLSVSIPRLAIAAIAFALVTFWKVAPWLVVVLCAILGAACAFTGASI